MAMESFYGGRQGASFVIVRSFDAIDNEVSGNQYVSRYYAVNENDIYIWNNDNFVERTTANYKNYSWKLTELSPDPFQAPGTPRSVETTDGFHNLSIVPAEGMVQVFSQGGDTTSGKNGVNYGEYVIIDTPDKNNPDNGKVFRRGLNDENDKNGLAGAEYIGQIVGPKGETPNVDIDSYDTIASMSSDKHTGSYNTSKDLVPGYSPAEQEYNDDIKYIYANVEDEYGNILGAVIGFKIPYLMVDYTVESANYYEEPSITKDSDQLKPDGTWLHPFYQKWNLKIPEGTPGMDASDFGVVPTMTMPAGFKDKNYQGALLWTNYDCTIPYLENGTQKVLNDSQPVEHLNIDITKVGVPLKDTIPPAYPTTVYVNKADCYMDVIRYKETSHEVEEPYSEYKEVENSILKTPSVVSINDDLDPSHPDKSNQKVHIKYNNGYEEDIGSPLNYIVEAVVSDINKEGSNIPNCHLLVYYSDITKNTSNIRYYSEVLHSYVTGWVDLGPVRGEPGGIHILKNVDDLDDLYEDGQQIPGKGIPPEELTPVDSDHAGWAVTHTIQDEDSEIYFYNYETKFWYCVGTINSSVMDPTYAIVSSKAKSDNEPDADDPDSSDISHLSPKGIWFGKTQIKSVY